MESRDPVARREARRASFLEKRTPHYPDRLSTGLPDVFPDGVEPQLS